jgi:hypothetical protein
MYLNSLKWNRETIIKFTPKPNPMTDKEIAQLIQEEFTLKTFGTTEQYLEVHEAI